MPGSPSLLAPAVQQVAGSRGFYINPQIMADGYGRGRPEIKHSETRSEREAREIKEFRERQKAFEAAVAKHGRYSTMPVALGRYDGGDISWSVSGDIAFMGTRLAFIKAVIPSAWGEQGAIERLVAAGYITQRQADEYLAEGPLPRPA